ncbi:cytochrome P450 [Absidia repens]|uniref:Cytochrome P450 n=1 Tax=Absidia repens TaxID=90262 RepID=A0A1X2ID19_9FUNG|nr:cytochrome P450 [Absidia repens]
MGKQEWYMISDPLLAHEIFVTKGLTTSDRPYHTYITDYYSFGGKGIVFTKSDKRWKKTRTAALSVLAPQRVNEFTDVLIYEADSLVQQLLKRTEQDGQVNPLTILQASSLNVILTTCFARRVTSPEDPLFLEIMAFVNQGMKMGGAEADLSGFLPILTFVDVLVGKKKMFRDFVANVRDPIFVKLIEEASSGDKDCLIKSFLALKEEYDLDDQDLIVIMSDLLAAGADTISVTLSWMFVILTHYPEVQDKLYEEVNAFYKSYGRLPTFEERDQLPYSIAVQKESMRFRPTTPFGIPHLSTEDVVVRDYLIPKNSVLISNMFGMHMNPEFYENPEIFNPDRFLDNTRTMSSAANGNINNRDHYNFGWGRRICPGIHLAEVEMFHMCTRIFATSKIAAPLDSNGKEVPISLDDARNAGIVLLPSSYNIRFIPRSDSPLHTI